MIAVTRAVSPAIANCELTHRSREVIDAARTAAEHGAYESTLRSLGVTVVRTAPQPALPDAVFVEDTAIVLDEVAILTRPGAESRRPEVDSIAETLGAYRTLERIDAPATIDGGDVLVVHRTLYVGRSTRTNAQGVEQLRAKVRKYDYDVVPVSFDGCLHLKSAATFIGQRTLLLNPRMVKPRAFSIGFDIIEVAPTEPDGGNALNVSGTLIYPEHHPATAERLRKAGLRVVTVPMSELAKAEAGVTCCSLLFEA